MIKFLPLLVALGCTSPNGDGSDSDGAIEITGYLDASRISVTSIESAASVEVIHAVIGEPEAAESDLDVMILNDRTGDYDVATAGDDGSFGLQIMAMEGDILTLTQGDAEAVEVRSESHSDFPELVQFVVSPPNAESIVFVELEFVLAPTDLDFVMHTLHGHVAHLVPGDNEHLYDGHIGAVGGDLVLIHGLDGQHEPTRMIELHVPAAR